MSVSKYRLLFFCAVAFLAATYSWALSGEGIRLTITNDGTEDLYVSVYDSSSKAPLVEHQRLNGFTSISVAATVNPMGLADITWTTISVDNRERHCGRGMGSGLDSDATVSVHADSSCQ